MSKKIEEPKKEEIILYRSMDEVMHDSMIPYAEHVILERALPRVEDGLKPVQRRILYTMLELGLSPDKPHRKSARIVGDCLGKYHPHGDSSVYEAMVHMAQPFAMSLPLVDGHGNFGSIDGDTAAAMRYTEARMTDAAMQLLRDIDLDTVDYSLNFDDTLKEPDLLPGRFPNLLINGAAGIAVGLATNIPPHNPGEAIDAAVAMISVGALAIGYLLLNLFSTSSNLSGDVCSTLFGSTSILTLTKAEVWLCAALSVIVVALFVLFYNRIFAVTFDEDFARAVGTRVEAYNLLIAVVIAVIIVLAMNLVGSLLISALIIFPALSAMRLFRSFRGVTVCSAVLSVLCALAGMLISIVGGTPVGSTIVAVDIAVFFICASIEHFKK